jgi:uncharacterized protein (TIGR03118 family)
MKTNSSEKGAFRSLCLFALVAFLLSLLCPSLSAKEKSNRAARQYRQTNLVSDLPGVAAVQDTNLVNAWGVSFSPTSPFWVSSTERGKALIYAVTNDAQGAPHVNKQMLEVTIPGEGSVTGQTFNNTSGFKTNLFLFVSEDGTISGWRPALGTAAETLTTRTGAVYKGVALITIGTRPWLLAANFAEGTVDAYDANATLVKQFSDRRAPDGYAPFNVKWIADQVFVTFAKQDDEKEDDVKGQGHGFIDILNPLTGRFHRFATGSDAGGHLDVINSPWGLALAPRSFGFFGDRLLVGNFGSGTIMAFDANGTFRGLLRGLDNQPIAIDGLWALTFGNGGRAGVPPQTLYFSAGPEDESHGLFGSLEPVHTPRNGHHHDDDDDDDDGNEDNQ